jgi:hypothetical protein
VDLNSYTGLLATLGYHLNRTDMADIAPVAIRMTEAELNRRLRLRRMQTTTSISVTGANLALPTDYNGWISLTVDGSPVTMTGTAAADLAATYGGSGAPTQASIEGGNIAFLPVPTTTYVGALTYWAKVPALTAQNTTNWVLEQHPDLYLYGCLAHLAPMFVEDERIGLWRGFFDRAIQGAKAADARETRTSALLRTDLPAQGSASLSDFLAGRV